MVPSPSITAFSLYNSSESSALSIRLGFNAAIMLVVILFVLVCLVLILLLFKGCFQNMKYSFPLL